MADATVAAVVLVVFLRRRCHFCCQYSSIQPHHSSFGTLFMCVHFEHSNRYTIQLIHIHRNFRLLNRFKVLAGKLAFHNLIEGMSERSHTHMQRE